MSNHLGIKPAASPAVDVLLTCSLSEGLDETTRGGHVPYIVRVLLAQGAFLERDLLRDVATCVTYEYDATSERAVLKIEPLAGAHDPSCRLVVVQLVNFVDSPGETLLTFGPGRYDLSSRARDHASLVDQLRLALTSDRVARYVRLLRALRMESIQQSVDVLVREG